MNDMHTHGSTEGAPSFAGATILAFGPAPMSGDEAERFTADYEVGTSRILRAHLRPNEGGRATVTFTGKAAMASMWLERGQRGSLKIYAEVDQTDREVETTIEVAVIPTGKRIPASHLGRVGSTNDGTHVYLLEAGLWERKRVEGDATVSGGTGSDAADQAGGEDATLGGDATE